VRFFPQLVASVDRDACMPSPIASPGTDRIPLHSIFAKPGLCLFMGMYVLGMLGLLKSTLADEGPGPVAIAIALSLGGLLLWKVRSLYRRVYMTREGIELTRPPRLVPWSKVGDAFRIPLTGSVAPICCIGIRDLETWDLHFMGRQDFDQVFAEGRKRLEPHA
jgi:hypothetical protein